MLKITILFCACRSTLSRPSKLINYRKYKALEEFSEDVESLKSKTHGHVVCKSSHGADGGLVKTSTYRVLGG